MILLETVSQIVLQRMVENRAFKPNKNIPDSTEVFVEGIFNEEVTAETD